MTVTTMVNSLTGNSFDSTIVAAAIATAKVFIQAYTRDTVTEGTSDRLDSAIALVAKEVLIRGRGAAKDASNAEVKPIGGELITEEVKELLDTEEQGSYSLTGDIQPSSSDHWVSY